MATIAEMLAAGSGLPGETPRLDAELLLCQVLGVSRSYLYTWPERQVGASRREEYEKLLARRCRGEPVAHLLGRREFWSLNLKVSPATLIPRPETELLVETTLDIVTSATARVLDLGTGTGAIALALAKERPAWSITAVDRIAEAVDLAKDNALNNQITNVTVLQSDWFAQLDSRQPFDAIVSNPPYIAPDDQHLQEGDVRYEPGSALVSDKSGMADIERIVRQAVDYLVTGGWLLLEHGYQQGNIVRELLSESGYTSVRTVNDLSGQERVTLAASYSLEAVT